MSFFVGIPAGVSQSKTLGGCQCLLQMPDKKYLYVNFYSFQQVYDKAMEGLKESPNTRERGAVLTKEDKVHGSLLVIQELIRNSSNEGEV